MQDQPISRTRLLQEGRIMKFESTYEDWLEGRLTQSEAAAILCPFWRCTVVAQNIVDLACF